MSYSEVKQVLTFLAAQASRLAGVTGSGRLGHRLRVFLIAPLLALSALTFPIGSATGQELAGAQPAAVVLELKGAIGPATTEYLKRALSDARERHARLVVLRIDTPGGLDTAMRDIIAAILASPVPVAAYVAPSGARAASAGTYILYASHLAAMAPGTNLGAATPVRLGGGGRPPSGGAADKENQEPSATAPDDAMGRKVVNDAVAYIRSLAELHGRNADWAERAVREAASLSARAAKDTGVIEIIATDVSDLLAQAHGRTVRMGGSSLTLDTTGLAVVPLEPDWRMRLLATITNPNVAYILLLIGIYGIVFEFLTPGTLFSGAIGAVCLLVGLFALNLLPINYAGLALIGLGTALMVTEAFTPSFGLFGVAGLAAFAIGSTMLFEGDLPGFSVALSFPVIITATMVSAVLLVIGATVAVRAHRRQVLTGAAELLGSSGEVLDWAGTHGHVRVHGERWRARSHDALPAGQRITVLSREGLTLIVAADTRQPPHP